MAAGHSTCSCRPTSWRYGEDRRPARCKWMLPTGAPPQAVARHRANSSQMVRSSCGVLSEPGSQFHRARFSGGRTRDRKREADAVMPPAESRAGARTGPMAYHPPPSPGGARAHRHARHDPAHHRHRLLPAAALVRPQPGRTVVQIGARRFAVPRTVSRCGRRHHRRAGSRRARYRDRRRQPLRSHRRRQVVVLLSHRTSRRHRRPSRHLARMDVASRPAARKDPVGGAGGVSARCRAPQAHPRPAGIRRPLAGGAAPHRPAGEVRRHLRPGGGLDAVGRVLQGRQGADPRPLRYHECGVPRAGRRRLPADPGRGAAAPHARPAARVHRRRPRIPHPGVQPPARGRERRDLGIPAGAIRTSSAYTGRCRATSAPCPTCCSSIATC